MNFSEHYADEGPLYFYGGPFSNFATSPFEREPMRIGDVRYEELDALHPVHFATTEHWFAAHKAKGWVNFLRIAHAPDPSAAKAMGRPPLPLRPDWEQIKYPVMVEGLREKFKIASYRAVLLETGSRPIAEDSPTDTEWGIANYVDGYGGVPEYTGKNLLGLALMQVRAECKGISAEDAKLKAVQIQEATWPDHTPHDIGVPVTAHR